MYYIDEKTKKIIRSTNDEKHLSLVSDIIEVCVYCTEDKNSKYHCCGENHFELAYVTENDLYLASELKKE